jgi:hypothetical protein
MGICALVRPGTVAIPDADGRVDLLMEAGELDVVFVQAGLGLNQMRQRLAKPILAPDLQGITSSKLSSRASRDVSWTYHEWG